jgi:hypothetical protein
MYVATPNHYCYPGSTILKKRACPGEQVALDAFEAAMVTRQPD